MQQKIIVEITVDWEDYQDVDPEFIFEDTGMPSAAKEGVTYKVITPPSSHQGDFITDMEAEVAKRYTDPESEFAQDFEIGASWAKEYLSQPAPPTNQGDFSHLGPEAELVINSVYEGAELWKQEYDDCRRLLQDLVTLKKIKDTDGKTDFYLKRQPKAWEAAIQFLSEYQHFE